MPTRIASVSGLRGIIGDGLDPSAVVEFAAAYAGICGSGPILVGHDGRRTAPMMVRAVAAGLSGAGRPVEVLGPVPTPTLGLLVRETGAAGGVQISASHNPPEYNGLKFFQPAGMVLGPAEGQAMLGRFEAKDFPWQPWDRVGVVHDPSAIDPYRHVERILPLVDVEAIRKARFTVVLDAGHGAGGKLGTALLRELGCSVRVLGGEPDGLYDHTPEPTEENLRELAAVIPAVGAAVGFAQDPDADRLAIIDETGRYIGEELTLALALQRRLDAAKGPVVLNLSTSRTAEDLAKAAGCPVYRTPVGEFHVVNAMREHDALLGGEGNGGVIDPRVGYVRDSLMGMALVLDLMAARREPLSRLVDALPKHTMLKTKFPVQAGMSVASLFDTIAAEHATATADRRDGLHLSWPDAWVQVRASNTEPIVRVIAESQRPERAEALVRSIAGRLG